MSCHVIRVFGKEKHLSIPLSLNYEIGLLDISFKYRNIEKRTLESSSYIYDSPLNNNFSSVSVFKEIEKPIKRHFDLVCHEIEPSIITGSTLRNLFIHSLSFGDDYFEFKNVEYHNLINNNLTVLHFDWPSNIEVIYFTLHCKPYAK